MLVCFYYWLGQQSFSPLDSSLVSASSKATGRPAQTVLCRSDRGARPGVCVSVCACVRVRPAIPTSYHVGCGLPTTQLQLVGGGGFKLGISRSARRRRRLVSINNSHENKGTPLWIQIFLIVSILFVQLCTKSLDTF